MSRPLEKLITAAVMVLTAPLLIVSAVLIRLEGGGSAIYRQTRVGRHGEEFEMLKLRTMIPGSDPVGVGTVVGRDDPRVTRIGRWLRRTSLDELPNLINVWRGEMALVGPRPTIPAQVADYTRISIVATRSVPGSPAGRRCRDAPASPGTSGSNSTWSTSRTARSGWIWRSFAGPSG